MVTKEAQRQRQGRGRGGEGGGRKEDCVVEVNRRLGMVVRWWGGTIAVIMVVKIVIVMDYGNGGRFYL